MLNCSTMLPVGLVGYTDNQKNWSVGYSGNQEEDGNATTGVTLAMVRVVADMSRWMLGHNTRGLAAS